MNKLKELVQMIGRHVSYDDFGDMIEDDKIIKFAKNNNLVIVYGGCDQIINFVGAINKELYNLKDSQTYIGKNKKVHNVAIRDETLCINCTYLNDYWKNNPYAILYATCHDGRSWKFELDIEYVNFIIHENNDFDEAIVFCLDDI